MPLAEEAKGFSRRAWELGAGEKGVDACGIVELGADTIQYNTLGCMRLNGGL